MDLIEKLIYYFNFPFVRYALIVGVLISLCAGLLGVSLLLRRYSMLGDGLSHVAFGAMSIATVLGFAPMVVAMPITIIVAVVLLTINPKALIKGDAAIAMLSAGALAVGYLLLNIFPAGSSNVSGDVCSSLFGSVSILTLSESDVWLCMVLAVIVIVLFTLFYHKIYAITFDENFCSATGINSKAYNTILAVIIAVVIVLAMKLVGALLISALIIFPALSAMRIYKSFLSVIICSAIISVFCSFVGIIFSVLFSTPVGSTIVIVNIIVFVIFSIMKLVLRR